MNVEVSAKVSVEMSTEMSAEVSTEVMKVVRIPERKKKKNEKVVGSHCPVNVDKSHSCHQMDLPQWKAEATGCPVTTYTHCSLPFPPSLLQTLTLAPSTPNPDSCSLCSKP